MLQGVIEVGAQYPCDDGTVSLVTAVRGQVVYFTELPSLDKCSLVVSRFRAQHGAAAPTAPEIRFLPPGATVIRVDFVTQEAGPEHVFTWAVSARKVGE